MLVMAASVRRQLVALEPKGHGLRRTVDVAAAGAGVVAGAAAAAGGGAPVGAGTRRMGAERA